MEVPVKTLVRILMTGLAAVPFTLLAVTSAAPAAQAEDNGVGLTPLMGFSTWNVPGRSPPRRTSRRRPWR
jgi:hypothetical protein